MKLNSVADLQRSSGREKILDLICRDRGKKRKWHRMGHPRSRGASFLPATDSTTEMDSFARSASSFLNITISFMAT